MPEELYSIRVSDDMHPVSLRVVRDETANVITITHEYLLKGSDSRDDTNALQPLTELFTRVITVDNSVDPHPTAVTTAIQTLGDYMESLAVAKESENPYT